VLEALFILLEFPSPSRRIFIGSHSLPPSLVRRIGPSGVPSGKLLGFIISHCSIESNPENISAITKMKAPTCIKDVQKLTGCMAALNRFFSRLGEQGLPFFKLLKHQEKFVWTTEVDQAFAQLKDFLSKPPILTTPRKDEQLLLYLAVTTHVVSTAIIIERQEDGHAYPV
jgi:hypothetical protein